MLRCRTALATATRFGYSVAEQALARPRPPWGWSKKRLGKFFSQPPIFWWRLLPGLATMGSTADQRAALKKQTNRLLLAAREGLDGQIEGLLELYRPYLLAMANNQLDPALRGKAGASDLVQETLWRAAKVLPTQLPADASELREFLGKLLLRRMDALRQRYRRTKKRQIRRERSLDDFEVQEFLQRLIMPPEDTPGSKAVRKERTERMLAALDKLPNAYRQVILWRNRDGLTWPEIGKKVDRSPDALRMFWKRAMARLKKILEPDELDDGSDG